MFHASAQGRNKQFMNSGASKSNSAQRPHSSCVAPWNRWQMRRIRPHNWCCCTTSTARSRSTGTCEAPARLKPLKCGALYVVSILRKYRYCRFAVCMIWGNFWNRFDPVANQVWNCDAKSQHRAHQNDFIQLPKFLNPSGPWTRYPPFISCCRGSN